MTLGRPLPLSAPLLACVIGMFLGVYPVFRSQQGRQVPMIDGLLAFFSSRCLPFLGT